MGDRLGTPGVVDLLLKKWVFYQSEAILQRVSNFIKRTTVSGKQRGDEISHKLLKS